MRPRHLHRLFCRAISFCSRPQAQAARESSFGRASEVVAFRVRFGGGGRCAELLEGGGRSVTHVVGLGSSLAKAPPSGRIEHVVKQG